MEDVYESGEYSCPTSSASTCPDEISIFVRQILLRSSSSSAVARQDRRPEFSLLSSSPSVVSGLPCSSRDLTEVPHPSSQPVAVADGTAAAHLLDVVSASSYEPFLDSSGVCARSGVDNVFPASVGANENESSELHCESEEVLEELMEETPAKKVPRGSSKRSRAAEAHNLSEKRRRSRINEKMKALQNLIPNSSKTDKASMLDDAIEYLKQLQLQVQMLALRNGLSLHRMYVPSMQPMRVSQMKMNMLEGNKSFTLSTTGMLPSNEEILKQTLFSLPNQCDASSQTILLDDSRNKSEPSFALESSIQAHLGELRLHATPKEICREDMLLRTHQASITKTETFPVDSEEGVEAIGTRASDLHGSGSLGPWNRGGNQSENAIPKTLQLNPVHNFVLPSHLNALTQEEL